MRITTGRGNKRQSIEIPTGSKIGVTPEHVADMMTIMRNHGVKIFSR